MMPLDALLLMLAALFMVMIATLSWTDRQHQDELELQMQRVLTSRGRQTIGHLAEMVDEHKCVLAHYHDAARALYRRGRYDSAAARMALGCKAIEDLAPDFLTAVRTLRHLTRAVSVIVSVEPVRGDALHAPELRGVAAVGQVLHHLLLTSRQQIRLRLGVVRTLFHLALRALHRTTARVTRRPFDAPTWERIEALVADLGTAGDEAVVAARQIVEALYAVDMRVPLRHAGIDPRT